LEELGKLKRSLENFKYAILEPGLRHGNVKVCYLYGRVTP